MQPDNVMKEIRKSLLILRETRSQSTFIPDALLQANQKKDQAQSIRQDISRRQMIQNSNNNEGNFSEQVFRKRQQRSLDYNIRYHDQTVLPKVKFETVYSRFQKTNSFYEQNIKVEQSSNKLQSSNAPIFMHLGSLTTRKNSLQIQKSQDIVNRIRHQKDNNTILDDNERDIMQPIQNKKQILFQKLLPIEKQKSQEREDGNITQMKQSFDPFQNSDNFFKAVKEKKLQTTSVIKKTNTAQINEVTNSNSSNNSNNNKQIQIEKVSNLDCLNQSDQTPTNQSRSQSSNPGDQKIIYSKSIQKIIKMKQFNLNVINQKNQHLIIEPQPAINIKPSQQQSGYKSIHPPFSSLQESETQSFQAKVSKYIQHLKMMQFKQSPHYSSTNYIHYRPKQLPEHLDDFMRLRQNSKKPDKQSKKVIIPNILYQNFSNINPIISNTNKNYLNNFNTNHANTNSNNTNNNYNNVNMISINNVNNNINNNTNNNTNNMNNINNNKNNNQGLIQNHNMKSQQGKQYNDRMEQIRLCPFNEINNSFRQNTQEQAYLDDYDLCQYVQNNAKYS